MAPGRARDERKERQWRCWIGEWRAGGLSVRAFRARRGLAPPSFVSVRRNAFLPGTFGRCSKETATAVKAYGY